MSGWFPKYRALIRRCARTVSLHDGEKLHCFLLKTGILSFPKTYLCNALLHMYSSCDIVLSARNVFEEIPSTHRDTVDWTTLMACCVRNGLPEKALHLFIEMEAEGHKSDEVTMVTVFGACSHLSLHEFGKSIHGRMIKVGLQFSTIAHNAAMDMYVKCCNMDYALRLFGEIEDPTVVSRTIIMSGELKWGGLTKARKMFDAMSERSEVTWTLLISGYIESGFTREALNIFTQMVSQSLGFVELNHVTLCSVLSSCSQSGDLTMGQWIHSQAIKMGAIDKSCMVGTSLIDMYCKCGKIKIARRVFHRIPLRNVVAWNAMINGLAMHGQGKAALDLFSKMLDESFPDDITFISVLSACSHSGLVDDGRAIFNNLQTIHNITPKIDHYACMVDLLGRGGHLDEAKQLIADMPFRPNNVILSSLLSSCKLHGQIELFDSITQDFSNIVNTDCHVLLSNTYAFIGRQKEAANIRRQVRKAPGVSYIHLKGVVHQFTSGDKSHPCIEEVYAMLDQMALKLKKAGYVADTLLQGSSHFDKEDEEEEKELAVMYHSERLAIAFGLTRTKPQTTLRIFKNLRICIDCHKAIKIMSEVFRREIIVRDRNRFHCFEHGSCSCADFW